MISDFANEPLLNFADPTEIKKFQQALDSVEQQLGKEYPLIIAGEEIVTEEKIISYNPSLKNQMVGIVAKATIDHAKLALDNASKTFASWSKVTPQQRAEYIFRAAHIMRNKKYELSSWLVYEAGKNWVEADADTAEAIDFLEFYGREMLRMAEAQPLVRISSEHNELIYIPLGVGVVISPWNFPLAIMAGMTAAAIVAGNTVVLKPASTTPVIAAKFMEILKEAGLPAGVVNYLPGSGGAIGDYLVSNPKTRFINFTGSKEVGLRINELAAKTVPELKWIKRVTAEMGGKDAIIVDSSADLLAAASAIVASAFGFQGQKCSACSRVIVVKDVYQQVVDLVLEKTRHLTIGMAKENQPVGPVIDNRSLQKIQSYIEIGKKECALLTGGQILEQLGGYYVQPTIFGDVSPQSVLAKEEIFGPVLALIKADDYDQALRIANDTEYGLTGAVFAIDKDKLHRARGEFHVGNLYFNRKCTGALVGVHPFGGFGMSGTDSKAGGRDYLKLFTQAKIVSEKV